MNTIANHSAFPIGEGWQVGLTKREYFAAIALQGILAESGRYIDPSTQVQSAVDYADALINELNATDPQP